MTHQKHEKKDPKAQGAHAANPEAKTEGDAGPVPAASAADAATAAAAASESLPAERVFTEKEVEGLVAAKESEMQDRYLRLAAEYQNHRRRVEREKESWTEEALERFAKDLLPVLDSFDRALAVREKDPAAAASGIEAVDRQFRGVLERHGMTRIDPAGGPFDPKLHEAVMRSPAADKAPGTVLAVFEKGWTMKSRLLRAARVQVAAAPEKG
jgi:molecular chaperone GrpE